MGTVRSWFARALVAGGIVVLAWVAVQLGSRAWLQRQFEAALEQRQAATPDTTPAASVPSMPGPKLPTSMGVGETIATLVVPRVKLLGVVVEGDDDSVLDSAIGHLPDTPLPWMPGNSALAAHRDGLFRPLKGLRTGDVLELRTVHGDFTYRVRETLIVKPEDVWVLDPTPTSMLTLISCYPFNYVGHAPQRFIVRAERMAPDGPDAISARLATPLVPWNRDN